MASIPAVVAVASWLFLRECITLRIGLAVACAALGIGLLAFAPVPAPPHSPSETSDAGSVSMPWLGNLLVFCAVLCEASYAVIGKSLTGRLGPRRICSLVNLWGLALATPLGLWFALQFDFGAVAPSLWGLVVLYALTASVWTVWLWMTGLKHVPASQAGVFTVMLPVSAALVGVLVLGERVLPAQVYAFALALLGVMLATWPTKRR